MKSFCFYIRCLMILSFMIILGCESNSDIELNPRTKVIVSALAYRDSSLVVYVYGSTAYTDTMDYAAVGNASVDVSVNGRYRTSGYIYGNSISTNVGNLGLQTGDVMSVSISGIEGKNEVITASSTMLEPVPVLLVDTATVIRDGTPYLEMYLLFEDPSETEDFYQIEARVVDGENFVPLSCSFSDYLFYLASASLTPIGDATNDIGIFTDEFIGGKYNITFSVDWNQIRKASVNDKDYQGHRNVLLEVILYRHTYDYYSFARTANIAQNYLILPVFGIPSIYSNVDNGEGIVSCMACSSYRLTISL